MPSWRNKPSSKQNHLERHSFEEGRALVDAAHIATQRLYCDALKFRRSTSPTMGSPSYRQVDRPQCRKNRCGNTDQKSPSPIKRAMLPATGFKMCAGHLAGPFGPGIIGIEQ